MAICKVAGCSKDVFSSGVCRPHYDRERLATAPPCSISGCDRKGVRKGNICDYHYRKKLQSSNPPCSVAGCEEPVHLPKYGLCNKHEFRYKKHGHTDSTRPDGWGSRDGHPLYGTWTWHRHKVRKNSMVKEWHDDFWRFVEDVGDRPDGHTFRKVDNTKPYGPDNWLWKKKVCNENKAEYQKKWRERNPRNAKSADLKRHFGITIDDYERMLKEQGGVCAICKEVCKDTNAAGLPRHMPVDHCHKTGKIRAILCGKCNKGLGAFRDDPDLLMEAAAYLEAHS